MNEGVTNLGDILELKRGNFICLSARPGMGKTSFALQIAMEYAQNSGNAVYVLSLDLTAEDVYLRMACALGEVDVLSARRGTFTEEEKGRISQALEALKQMDIIIDDPRVLTASQVVSRIEALDHVGLVVIDDGRGLLHMFDPSMPQVFKRVCQQKNIPLLYAHHLPRKVERRWNKRPRLKDLKGMPTLVRAADTILFLYRDSYYHIRGGEEDLCQIHLAKNRYGSTSVVLCAWNRRCMKFGLGSRT